MASGGDLLTMFGPVGSHSNEMNDSESSVFDNLTFSLANSMNHGLHRFNHLPPPVLFIYLFIDNDS